MGFLIKEGIMDRGRGSDAGYRRLMGLAVAFCGALLPAVADAG